MQDVSKKRLVSLQEAAAQLGVCAATIRRMTDLGQLPAVRIRGRRKFLQEELDAYIDSNRWYRGTRVPA